MVGNGFQNRLKRANQQPIMSGNCDATAARFDCLELDVATGLAFERISPVLAETFHQSRRSNIAGYLHAA